MRGAAPFAAAAGLLLVVPVVVAVLLGGGASTPAQAAVGGLGHGLKAGTAPAAYVALVSAAGAMCPAAPASVIAAQIEQESGWNPKAVSPAGAEGISQFLPGTWPSWSKAGESPFDPAAAIPAQGRYDCSIAAQMQAWQGQGKVPASLTLTELMLAGYNAGPYAVLSAAGIPQNGQTPGYVAAITARAAHFADTTGVVPGGGPFAAKEIAAAQSQIGQPYSWDGGTYTGPTLGQCTNDGGFNDCHIVGWDCSGLVMYAVYQASGGAIKLSHDAQAQGDAGKPVDRDSMLPGDVIAFANPGESVAHHIGIYIGNDQMIDAPQSGELVRIDSLTSGYYQAQQWKVARFG
ncbi:NlpC/P60 family protein [Jatrophihabitans lederbergiae]|uniref:NlpC/P60 family protein n=1 Tax=Jatrophihabitans lederbergiae TaxID=3075547 RepID=A0ABU2JBV9_9ACTN|nr:NlpC/P60 family protein [Jatrophihabitans sp. DSM 44399]MDT0262471.1 NlpC/P60 family protein [Jatrophihabitans sp. DSM 44399]